MTHELISFLRRDFIDSHFAKIFPKTFLPGFGDFDLAVDPEEVMREG